MTNTTYQFYELTEGLAKIRMAAFGDGDIRMTAEQATAILDERYKLVDENRELHRRLAENSQMVEVARNSIMREATERKERDRLIANMYRAAWRLTESMDRNRDDVDLTPEGAEAYEDLRTSMADLSAYNNKYHKQATE